MEGLRRSDLKDMIDNHFTVDQFQSKMGDDKNTIVLRFRAVDKEPATDLMEFIEKGYDFVLDADVSSGEERDGQYSIFVELERTPKAPSEVHDLLNGLTQLCDCTDWRFRWYKETEGYDFSEDEFKKCVPLTPEEYEAHVHTEDTGEVADFFDQGSVDEIEMDESRNITFTKRYKNI